MKDKTKFWNRIAKKYSKRPVPSQEIYEEKLKRTQALFTPESEVLEVGCGTGTTSLIHAPLVKHIIATDFSTSMIQIAKDKARDKKIENVTFKVESIEEMDYAKKNFDMVMAHSVLHLLEDKREAIEKIYRLTKPGGYFISSTVCVEDYFRLFKYIWPIVYKTGLFPYVSAFTSDHLVNEVSKCGFEIIHQWIPNGKSLFLIARKPVEPEV